MLLAELRNLRFLLLTSVVLVGILGSTIMGAATHTYTKSQKIVPVSVEISPAVPLVGSEVSIVQNGGFEEGLRGWAVENVFLASSGVGFPSVSATLFHSGASSVALNFLSSNAIGGGGQSMESTGIYQTVNVNRMAGLHLQAWFSMRQTASQVAARVRVQVGSLEVCYYVAYDSERRMRSYDNGSSKSLFAFQMGPGQTRWVMLDQQVDQDFRTLFGSAGQSVFQQESTTVRISLELIGFGSISNFQTMFWDDIQGFAVSAPTTTASTTTTTVSSTELTSTTSSQVTSTFSQVSTTRMISSALSTGELTVAGSFPVMQVSVAIAIVLTLILSFYLAVRMRRRTPTGVSCQSCGARDLPIDSIYCPECGAKLDGSSSEKPSVRKSGV